MAMAMAMAIAMTTPQAIIYNFNLLLSSTNCRHGWMLFIIRDVNLTVKFIISLLGKFSCEQLLDRALLLIIIHHKVVFKFG